MAAYIGLLRKEKGSDCGVSFPDFPGCVTAGKSLDEAREFAAEALAFHISGMLEDGEAIPRPASLEDVMADPDSRDAVAILVEVSDPKPRAVRVNITLDERTLREIDEHVDREGLSRSSFLAMAARHEIERSA